MSNLSLQSDKTLFERCFRDNYQALCFFASGILHDDAASEDVVQEAFVRLLKMNKIFDSYDHLKHYLYVAVRNLCIDKSKENQNLVSLEGNHEKDSLSKENVRLRDLEGLENVSEDIEIQIVRSEMTRMITAAIEELAEGQRNVFKLAYMEDKSNEEIAEILGLSINTVKVQKQRAKNHLREKLQDIYPLLFVLIKYVPMI